MDDGAWWVPLLPVTVLLVGLQVARRHRGRATHWYGGLALMALGLLGQAWIAEPTWLRIFFVLLGVAIVPLGHARRPVGHHDRSR